jgi:hypothetical protein
VQICGVSSVAVGSVHGLSYVVAGVVVSVVRVACSVVRSYVRGALQKLRCGRVLTEIDIWTPHGMDTFFLSFFLVSEK